MELASKDVDSLLGEEKVKKEEVVLEEKGKEKGEEERKREKKQEQELIPQE